MLIKKAEILHPESGCERQIVPGRVCKLNDGSMAIDCGRGSLKLLKVQLEGKGETDGSSFLNGYSDIAGKVLG